MPRRSRKLAARQAALAGRRKLKRQQKSRPGLTLAVENSDATSDGASESVEQNIDADEVNPGQAEVGAGSEPIGTEPEVVTAAPWPYSYVLRDVKRIGIFSVGIFVTIGVLALLVG